MKHPKPSSATDVPQSPKAAALTEIREDDDLRKESLAKMKEWLAAQTNISCRSDDSFLLRFLRFRKFRLEEAQENLIKYLKMRADHPRWFSNLDIRDPQLAELIDGGYYFALPQRDQHGRRVFFNRTAVLDPVRYSNCDQMRTMLLCFESLLEDQENQVLGFTYILDEKDVGFSFLSLWTVSEVTKAIHCCEKTLPMRHKQVHFLNLSTTFGAIFEFVKTLLSDKMTGRIKVHSDVNGLHTVIDPKILPQEYGGDVPMATMIKQYRAEAEAVRTQVLSLDQMSVSKSPETQNKISRTLARVHNSFKKLEID